MAHMRRGHICATHALRSGMVVQEDEWTAGEWRGSRQNSRLREPREGAQTCSDSESGGRNPGLPHPPAHPPLHIFVPANHSLPDVPRYVLQLSLGLSATPPLRGELEADRSACIMPSASHR